MKKTRIFDSSSISFIGYDEDKEILEIQYKPSGIYQYLKVQPSMYKALMKASSKGEFINKFIKPRYDFKKMDQSDR